jgi:hypothetical protein
MLNQHADVLQHPQRALANIIDLLRVQYSGKLRFHAPCRSSEAEANITIAAARPLQNRMIQDTEQKIPEAYVSA